MTNAWTLLPPRTLERLEVDGVAVAEGRLGWTGSFATLSARVDLGGRSRHLEARLAQAGAFSIGCHVLVDGELVGGDVHSDIVHPTPERARELHEQGFLGMLLSGSLLRYGLPYAFVMTLLQRPDTAAGALGQFAALMLMFGIPMSWLEWRSICQQIEGYDRCA